MRAFNIELDNININDYPDFVDAFAVSAEHSNGDSFTDQELDILNEEHTDQIYDAVISQLF